MSSNQIYHNHMSSDFSSSLANILYSLQPGVSQIPLLPEELYTEHCGDKINNNLDLSMGGFSTAASAVYSNDFSNTDPIAVATTPMTTFPIKNEQQDYLIDNGSDLNCPLLFDNVNYSHNASPIASSADDMFYSNNSMIDYFMSAASSSSPTSRPLPSLSPEINHMGLYYFDDQSQFSQHEIKVKEEEGEIDPSIKTEQQQVEKIQFGSQDKYKGRNSKSTAASSKKKVYPCNFCNRSFARKYDVARHKRIHTGMKPYVCPCCSKGFSRSDARARHFRTEIDCRGGPEKMPLTSGKHQQHSKRLL